MVTINGQAVDAAGKNLRDYLTSEGYHNGHIAIELNGTVVPRTTYGDVTLTDGDTMEIVQFVGGG
ncbi:MAG: sulfur carrier protein ThiS [Megasphaera sp.]|jgi:thiamine biosynthesis protein ThiS|nr:sulfur carrier protein ThiS [Megasphaera sp.]MCH4218352.1 sulfur carrier protein ThiS [Megasphaera sp.]